MVEPQPGHVLKRDEEPDAVVVHAAGLIGSGTDVMIQLARGEIALTLLHVETIAQHSSRSRRRDSAEPRPSGVSRGAWM